MIGLQCERGEAVEILETRVEGILALLQKDVGLRCYHRSSKRWGCDLNPGYNDHVSNKGELLRWIIQGMPYLAYHIIVHRRRPQPYCPSYRMLDAKAQVRKGVNVLSPSRRLKTANWVMKG